jgi:hypothetical protein
MREQKIKNEINLSFWPDNKLGEWNLIWINQILDYLPMSFVLVNQYIKLERIPKLIFISSKYRDQFISENVLPSWSKAVCCGENIFILFDNDLLNWRNIINHELFHAGVFQMYSDPLVIPHWFNESIAYLVGKNTDFNRDKLIIYLRENFVQIKESLVNNLMLKAKHEISFEIIHSLGHFVGMSFTKEIIKSFFNLLQNQQDFKNLFHKGLGISLIDFIDDWYEFIIFGGGKLNTKLVNIKGEDGCINLEGKLSSKAAMFKVKDINFWDNIEDNIIVLVRVLISKGIETFSSCRGHYLPIKKWDSRAYVRYYTDTSGSQRIERLIENYNNRNVIFEVCNYEFEFTYNRPTARIKFCISAKYRERLNRLINDFAIYIDSNF